MGYDAHDNGKTKIADQENDMESGRMAEIEL
jgi:hypothetical protein